MRCLLSPTNTQPFRICILSEHCGSSYFLHQISHFCDTTNKDTILTVTSQDFFLI